MSRLANRSTKAVSCPLGLIFATKLIYERGLIFLMLLKLQFMLKSIIP